MKNVIKLVCMLLALAGISVGDEVKTNKSEVVVSTVADYSPSYLPKITELTEIELQYDWVTFFFKLPSGLLIGLSLKDGEFERIAVYRWGKNSDAERTLESSEIPNAEFQKWVELIKTLPKVGTRYHFFAPDRSQWEFVGVSEDFRKTYLRKVGGGDVIKTFDTENFILPVFKKGGFFIGQFGTYLMPFRKIPGEVEGELYDEATVLVR